MLVFYLPYTLLHSNNIMWKIYWLERSDGVTEKLLKSTPSILHMHYVLQVYMTLDA